MERQESFEIFNDAIKSEATRKYYKFYLNKFLIHSQAKDYDSLKNLGPSVLEQKIIDYVRYLKRKVEAGISSPNGLKGRVNPIELFLIQNDIVINWKKIKRMFPRLEKKKGDLPYTLDDLKVLLKTALSPRNKAIIAFFTSTGVRPESIIELEMRHIKQMNDGCVSVLIYENDPEEYPVFLTPEAWGYLKEYFKNREINGEKITASSPIFRNDYAETVAWKNAKPMTTNSLFIMMRPILAKTKIRGKLTPGAARYHKASFTGFRKWYETTLDNIIGINSNVVEKLMGHKNDLRGVYYNPDLNTRFVEFQKAIPFLTISDEKRQKLEIKSKDKEISELQQNHDQIQELKEKLDNTEKHLQKHKKRLDRIDREHYLVMEIDRIEKLTFAASKKNDDEKVYELTCQYNKLFEEYKEIL